MDTKDIAIKIVKAVNNQTNDYDSVEVVEELLEELLVKA